MRKIGDFTWERKARNRLDWKTLEEAYVSQDNLTARWFNRGATAKF